MIWFSDPLCVTQTNKKSYRQKSNRFTHFVKEASQLWFQMKWISFCFFSDSLYLLYFYSYRCWFLIERKYISTFHSALRVKCDSFRVVLVLFTLTSWFGLCWYIGVTIHFEVLFVFMKSTFVRYKKLYFHFFLSVPINVMVSVSFSRCLSKLCFLLLQNVTVCGTKKGYT